MSGHLCWSWTHVFIPLPDSRALDWRVLSFTTIGMIFCDINKTHRKNHVFIPTPARSQRWRYQRGGDCWRGSLRSPEAGSKGRDSGIHPGHKSMEKTAKVWEEFPMGQWGPRRVLKAASRSGFALLSRLRAKPVNLSSVFLGNSTSRLYWSLRRITIRTPLIDVRLLWISRRSWVPQEIRCAPILPKLIALAGLVFQ